MNIAFHAPLKSPNSDVPSGDRTMARNLIGALEHAGHRVEVASEFTTREPHGDRCRQEALAREGKEIARQLTADYLARPEGERPHLWFTYHLYYKAPDWIGPGVSSAMNIPYVVAEASHAPKRAGGAWDFNHRAVISALTEAELIIGLNSNDRACVESLRGGGHGYVELAPFIIPPDLAGLDRNSLRRKFAAQYELDDAKVWLIAVAMMRDDAKLRSYQVLAEAMRELDDLDFDLILVGDGPARSRVERQFEGLKARFTGARLGRDLSAILLAADVFVWPAVREAYGMALLEAQFHGLPVIAARTGGVPDIVEDGVTGLLSPEGDAGAFAASVRTFLSAGEMRARFGQAARVRAEERHGLAAASVSLDRALRDLLA